MSKHTPGPWRVVENRVPSSLEIYAGETVIVECWRRADVQTEMANAYLIAAAPDLLKVLEGLLDCAIHGFDMPNDNQFALNARAAIAKAKGEV